MHFQHGETLGIPKYWTIKSHPIQVMDPLFPGNENILPASLKRLTRDESAVVKVFTLQLYNFPNFELRPCGASQMTGQ